MAPDVRVEKATKKHTLRNKGENVRFTSLEPEVDEIGRGGK